jgi:hypothetical protein
MFGPVLKLLVALYRGNRVRGRLKSFETAQVF